MVKELLIRSTESVKTALRRLDAEGGRVLLVVDGEDTLLGTLSDGDIRRFILSGHGVEDGIEKAFNRNPSFFFRSDYTIEKAQQIMTSKRITMIPIVDDHRKVETAVFWEEVFAASAHLGDLGEPLELPVIIMAGGKGTRLAPFTSVLPKPLIPIGDKTVLEVIMQDFRKFGIRDFRLTLNYRGEMIRAYFDGIEKDYDVGYLWEKEFRGTAGSLILLKGSIEGTFIVSNCDIVVKANYRDVFDFHKRNKSMLTIVSSIQHYVIPYGVVEFRNGGEVHGIREKPEYSFPVNTGVYLLESQCLDFIQTEGVFNMTDLISALIDARQPVYTYPVNEKEYVDIGQWEEYRNAINRINSLT